MKSALVIDQDAESRKHITKLMQWLGFAAAPVSTPEQAMNAVKVIDFGLVVTTVARQPNDRRAVTGELKKAAPGAVVVYVAENEEDYRKARAGWYAGVSGVIKRPVSPDALRRIVEFGMDGEGLYAACVAPEQERRRVRKEDTSR